jgi:hypothetical protein
MAGCFGNEVEVLMFGTLQTGTVAVKRKFFANSKKAPPLRAGPSGGGADRLRECQEHQDGGQDGEGHGFVPVRAFPISAIPTFPGHPDKEQ